jgi:hypothetical protein
MEKEVKSVENRRREGNRFKRTLETLYSVAERFRYGSEKDEEQINRKNEKEV